MIQFQVYASGKHQYLAVTPIFGLRIEKRGVSKTLYRVSRPVLVKTVDAKLIIERPARNRERDAFKDNIKVAREQWVQLGMSGSIENRQLFFRAVLAACSYFNKKALRQVTIRDVAKLIGIKSYPTFYRQLHLEARRQLKNREKVIPEAKDLTLVSAVRNFQSLWPSIIGYSSKLDTVFKYELKLYTSAMRARSLRLEG